MMNLFFNFLVVATLVLNSQSIIMKSALPSSFDYLSNIDSTIIQSVRYASEVNFIGQVVEGYRAKKIIMTKLAGNALSNVQQQLKLFGYSLVVYDAYRPQKAVDNFIRWVNSPQDNKTKQLFYPFMDKTQLFKQQYLYQKSGHSRGSTVDLSIIPLSQSLHNIKIIESTLNDGRKVKYMDDGTIFTCTHFDFFGPPSNQDTNMVSQECLERRNFLRSLMLKHGFKILPTEWWHYTLVAQPFPDTYFDFDII